MHRRQFLAVGAAAAVSAALPAADKDKPAMIPAIDTHQHLWDPAVTKQKWLKKGDELHAPFTPTEYAAAIDGLNIVKSVYMEVDVDEDDQQREADYVLDLCAGKKTTMVAAVIAGRPASPTFAGWVGKFRDSKYVKGVRQVLHADATPAGYCLGDDFVKGVRLLGELGLRFDLCLRPTDLGDACKLADRCPDTRFVLDHCGNPQKAFTDKQRDQWKADLAEVAKRRNVMCKVSGFLANGWPKGNWTADEIAPVVNATVDTFGASRCLFGGDWPVLTKAGTFKDWLTALRTILSNRPEADQKKILHSNAEKFYEI